MNRIYTSLIKTHLTKDRQIIFLSGPRQIGKTTLSRLIKEGWGENNSYYFNWDNRDHRQLIISGESTLANYLNIKPIVGQQKKLVIFDELHKLKLWKQFLKGFFDTYEEFLQIIVTGSARLDLYKSQGDSLMGRYFCYRMHPLSIRELLCTEKGNIEISSAMYVPQEQFIRLLKFGGFPEPFIKQEDQFSIRWHSLRNNQLFREDIRDLTQVQELSQIEMLAEVLTTQVGKLINYTNLSKMIRVSVPTIMRWIECLESFYYCFKIRPWFKNVKRSLVKEPKIYMWDWSLINDPGERAENFVASHLFKAINFWQDLGLGDYQLTFLRDKNKREVDFLIIKNDYPWILIEVKLSHKASISESLYFFKEQIDVKHAFQLVFDLDPIEVDFLSYNKPIIIPVQSFLSQLI